MSRLEIVQIPCLSDNYGYLIHDPDAGVTAAIDTPEVGPIKAALKAHGWTLTHILNTHHHYDHAGGNEQLKAETGCTVIGPKGEADAIPTLDQAVGEGDALTFGNHQVRILDVPGHTRGHIAYYFSDIGNGPDKSHGKGQGAAFVGDALFALGCGRVFEGTHDQMWTSLQKLMALPDDTAVYCAHEYTAANAKFAITIEPGNKALTDRIKDIEAKRAKGLPTVPTSIGLEKQTNPFLRPMSPEVQQQVGLAGAPLLDVFSETRKRKDNF